MVFYFLYLLPNDEASYTAAPPQSCKLHLAIYLLRCITSPESLQPFASSVTETWNFQKPGQWSLIYQLYFVVPTFSLNPLLKLSVKNICFFSFQDGDEFYASHVSSTQSVEDLGSACFPTSCLNRNNCHIFPMYEMLSPATNIFIYIYINSL